MLAAAMTVGLSVAYAQDSEPCNLAQFEEYITVQKITHNERSFLIKRAAQVDEDHCGAGFINANGRSIEYLMTNFSDHKPESTIAEESDSVAVARAYYKHLGDDPGFSDVLIQLQSKLDHPERRDTVSMNELMNIAVKFFSIKSITEQGYYAGKVCVGINGITSTEAQRSPFLEAFCFDVISSNYRNPEYNIYGEFVKAIKELYTLNLGVDTDDRLLRAQGAMFMLMKNSEVLQDLLKLEYEKRSADLPFVLEVLK